MLLLATVLISSCTRYVDDARAVAGPDRSTMPASDASQCEAVDAPLTTIPAQGSDEPVMKIPQPQEWDRSTKLDSELIRFAMINHSLVNEDSASSVVVTLESLSGIEDPDAVFESQREALESMFGATDLRVIEHTLCGLPAETVHYRTPGTSNIAPHPATVVIAVLHTDDMTYAATVTVGGTDADNPTYRHDADMILTGFQLLPPAPR